MMLPFAMLRTVFAFLCLVSTVFGRQPNAIRLDGREFAKLHMLLRLR